MHIISRKRLREFGAEHPDAVEPLNLWWKFVRQARWKSPADVKAQVRTASFPGGNQVIFDVGGNKFRIVTDIYYEGNGTVLVRQVMTHEEYDHWNDQQRKRKKPH